jgi:AAA15 family ATPase/GTPase
MLYEYTFSNFRSFKNKTSLTMRAGKQRTLNENLIREDGNRIIPSAVIYGANASGKSNIIMSLALMREIILSGSLKTNVPGINNLELYPFAHNGENRPITFEIEFKNNGHHLLYGFEVFCTLFEKSSRRITREALYVAKSKNNRIKLFERDKNKVTIMKDKKALNEMQLR